MSREETVGVTLRPQELEHLRAAAAQTGMELPAFLRSAALIVAGDIRPQEHAPHALVSIYREAASRGHVWEEAELRARGLPLYWSEVWVRARLAEGKTVSQLAVLSGSRTRTVQHHVRVMYGIQAFRTLTDAQIASIREQYQAGVSRQEIAADLGVSNVTVGKYVRDLPTARERDAGALRERVTPATAAGEPTAPNIQGLRNWSERLFAQRAASLTWPTSTATIATTLFSGNHAVARDWTGRMVRKGRLVRLTKGWFDLNRAEAPETEPGTQATSAPDSEAALPRPATGRSGPPGRG